MRGFTSVGEGGELVGAVLEVHDLLQEPGVVLDGEEPDEVAVFELNGHVRVEDQHSLG